MPAGRLRNRVTFQETYLTADGGGGNAHRWRPVATVWGGLQVERGRERLEAGRLESAVGGVLTVRVSKMTEAITPENRVLVDGVPYQIRSITNPDRRGKYFEMTVERGVAT